jgi:hypothetical protein
MQIPHRSRVEVACEKGGSFSTECLIEQVEPGEERSVRVRVAGSTGASGLAVRFFAGEQMASATVTDAPAGGREPAEEDRLVPGLYEGFARLVSVGIAEDLEAASLLPPLPLEIPLRAQVFFSDGAGVLALEEQLAPLRVLLPDTGAPWVGALSGSGPAAGTVDFPSFQYLTVETGAQGRLQILLEAEPAEWTATGESVHFPLRTRFSGVLIGSRSPVLAWAVHLSRSGALPDGATAPAVPADAQLDAEMGASRGLNRLQWEAAVAHAVTPNAADVATMSPEAKRDLLATFGRQGETGTLYACGLSSGAVNTLARFGLDESWQVRAPWGDEPRAPSEFVASAGPLLGRLASPFALADRMTTSADLVLPAGESPRSLPCEVSFAPSRAEFADPACGVAEVTYAVGDLDLCEAMAEHYGCELAEVSGQTLTVNVAVSFEDTGAGGATCSQAKGDISILGEIRRVCRLPLAPASCAELAACWDGPAGSTRESVRAPFLAAQALEVSGDLRCGAGTRAFAWEADLNAELPAGDENRLTVSRLLDACALDYAKLAENPPAETLTYGDGLVDLFGSEGCVDGARMLFALGVAGDPDRQRALTPTAAVIPEASALFARLAQRWLLQHALLAREAAQAERMADLLRRSGEVNVGAAASEVLEESLSGWNLLLHPRFATPLAQLPAAVLDDPDYRPMVVGQAMSREAGQDQVLALPASLARTLESQLALVDRDLESAALRRDQTALARAGRSLRYASLLLPFWAQLENRSRAAVQASGGPDPLWWGALQTSASSLKSRVGRILTSARAIALGENPLGISEEDLPLYFFGDEQGANGRFVAISDFLIGTGPGDYFAWAPMLVKRAEDLFTTARTKFLAQREREVQVRKSEAELSAELDALRRDYGDRICNLCWREDLACSDILESWTDFDPDTCFIRYTDPICQVDEVAFNALLSEPQVRFRMCLVGELRRRAGTSVGFVDEALNSIADRFGDCDAVRYPVACPDGGSRCVSCTVGGHKHVGAVSADLLRTVGGTAAVSSRVTEDATNACLDRYPALDPTLPSRDDLPGAPVSLHECYTGAIGEAVLALRGAVQDVLSSQSDLADLERRYDIKMQSCLILDEGNAKLNDMRANHAAAMQALRKNKQIADGIATASAGIKDCFSAGDKPWQIVGACIAAAAEVAAVISSGQIQSEIEVAQDNHSLIEAELSAETAAKQCAKDAEMELVGTLTASLGLERAAHDVEAAAYLIEELKSSASTYFDEGRAALAAARDRYVAPLSHEQWIDEDVETFLREMRLARRAVYLAVRAVEYETQQSLGGREATLSASNPAALRAVLEDLWTTAATRGVGGHRPTDLKVVLSLRTHLLQLADQSEQPEGWQALSDVERFRLLLQAERHAVYSESGRYLGQRIPFDLAPLGALELGNLHGIPVLAATDCAERLWSVNASILGSEQLFRGDSPSFTRIELLKSNNFYSQWCNPPAGGPQFQSASVRPSRNLFRDPEYGTDVGGEAFGVQANKDLESRARIEAYFNVPRAELEKDAYANGETSELAARGLYGSYALFIPADVLALDGGDGLVLNEVEDILLRLDYVSVAR